MPPKGTNTNDLGSGTAVEGIREMLQSNPDADVEEKETGSPSTVTDDMPPQ